MGFRIELSPMAQTTWDSLDEREEDELLDLIDEVFDWIESGDRKARKHKLESPAVVPNGYAWVVSVRYRGQTWAIVWGPASDSSAIVHGIGMTEDF